MVTTTQPKRIEWLDLLKFIAIFMMIAVHCTDNVTPEQRSEPWYNMWGSLYGSLLRPAIPLFLMVTGVLLLPVKETMTGFYKKRMMRLIVPFLIWSVAYNLFPWVSGLLGCELSTINEFFAWVTPSHSFSDAIKDVLMIPFAFTYYATQMWYVYALIGIYLFLPIFSAWVKQASKREQQIFLGIWFVSLFIPYLRQFLVQDLWGVCSWNEFGMLYYFAGFNGFLLLGYYMKNNPLNWSWAKIALVGLPMFAVGYCITFFGFKDITATPGQPAALVELFYTYCSPNVLLMTIPIVMMAQKINFTNVRFNKLLASMGACTFGIWMSHYMILGPIYNLIEKLPVHVMAKMVIGSVVILLVNWVLVALVLRWKKYGKWIMG